MESTQLLETSPAEVSPAQAALSALEERAQNGQKVTAKELAEARAALDLEGFAAIAEERAEVKRKAEARALKIAELNERVEAIKAEDTLAVAREKLAAALDDFGSVCADYEARRVAIISENGEFSGHDEGADLRALKSSSREMERARMKSTVEKLTFDRIRPHYDRRSNWEMVE